MLSIFSVYTEPISHQMVFEILKLCFFFSKVVFEDDQPDQKWPTDIIAFGLNYHFMASRNDDQVDWKINYWSVWFVNKIPFVVIQREMITNKSFKTATTKLAFSIINNENMRKKSQNIFVVTFFSFYSNECNYSLSYLCDIFDFVFFLCPGVSIIFAKLLNRPGRSNMNCALRCSSLLIAFLKFFFQFLDAFLD